MCIRDSTCIHLTQRAITGLEQVAAMRRIAMPDLYGQLGLPVPAKESTP